MTLRWTQLSAAYQWTIAQSQSSAIALVGLAFTKQHEWAIAADKAKLNASLPDTHNQVHLAVLASHSDDWLHALPISSCDLCLDDEAVRVALGLRFGARFCEPHLCPCDAKVDPEGTHGFACRQCLQNNLSSQHQRPRMALLGRTNIPAVKKPVGQMTIQRFSAVCFNGMFVSKMLI